ncbi:MAG TPA: molybdopterin-dependent oxidoreductase [Acidimicrobiales bacterium]|nr:molybdopterin-dependent oxidoreductase [Acidimicrobiales bacterium]
MQQVKTFCRVCEPSCGLVADVEDGRLVGLKADFDHPVTKGYACHKGIATLDIHDDPDRLDTPMRRAADGTWAAASWDDAMGEIATRLRSIIERDGVEAVAMYTGNPMAFNALGQAATGSLAMGLGLRRTFSSGTQDCANKFVASQAVFGTAMVHPIPDLDHTELCLIIGENPRVSQSSFFSVPNVINVLRQASSRGARIVFVNPRRIETPERGVGDTVLIKPDTDLYFLAALLTEIDRLGGFDENVLRRHATHVEELRAFIAPYDAETTSAVTGIDPDVTRELAQAWASSGAASVHASTGVNMGRQGTLAYWLVQMLSFVTGNLDREGGNLKSDGFYPNARAGAGVPEQMYTETEWGTLRRGSLPGNLMADAILDAELPVRAMIVVAGNPLLSIGGGERLRKAFEQLELLVCIDIYRNATGELAHFTLPATDQFERDDLNVVNIGLSYRPFVQYTPQVVEPAGERRPEWWICHRLLQELGKPSLLDDAQPDLWGKWRHMMQKGSGIDLDALRAEPSTVVELPAPQPGRFFDDQVLTADGRIDCCPPVFAPALARAHELFVAMASEPDGLKLITRRDRWMMNSWFRNIDRLQRAGRDDNPLYMHPDDAAARGLDDGATALASNCHGEVEVTVRFDAELRPGVVAMAHGWGNERTSGMSRAQGRPGVNCNVLLPAGAGSFEPLSSQAHMTGVPVEVAPVSR